MITRGKLWALTFSPLDGEEKAWMGTRPDRRVRVGWGRWVVVVGSRGVQCMCKV